jgi:CheY-like chemotaxis protein
MIATCSHTLLITADDPNARELLREILEPIGFRTWLAESGEQAIDIIRSTDIHLCLMEFHLPRLSGLEAARISRDIKADLPTILLTGEPDATLLRRALEARIYCVLPTPPTRDLVVYHVHRALRKVPPPRWNPSALPPPTDPPVPGSVTIPNGWRQP